MKILVADDESKIRRIVCDFLKKFGYSSIEAKDGEETLEIFEKNKSDISLIILDIMMPEIDGWQVCKKIRKQSNVPIIMLTARSEEFDMLQGYEAGVDDYVTKPFSPTILIKRVEALLRRTNHGKGSSRLIINHEAHEVLLEGKELELTLKEYDILKALTQEPGKVFSRRQLLDLIWGYDFEGDFRTVDSHVARLRTKLGEWGSKHLKTVYGIGYKIEDAEQ